MRKKRKGERTLLANVFISLVVLLLLTIPVGVVLLMAALVPNLLNPQFAANAAFLLRQVVGAVDSTPLLAVPMFVLSGIIMARGGVSEKLFNVFSYFVGKKTGGLPCAVVITCLFYGAISGSAPATTAAVGAMTIPILVGLGYDLTFCAALLAIAGGLGIIIPPSIPFIIYSMTSNESVGAMFMGGILPGILIGACLMVYCWWYCKTHGEDKEKINASVDALRARGLWNVFKDSVWALMSPIIILGGIYSGIVTPTEAAVVSVVYALIICLFVYKSLKPGEIIGVLREAVSTYAPLLLILGTATAFGRVLTLLQAPQEIATAMTSIFNNKIVLLLVINVFLLFVGMIIDTTPAILILTPILLPVMQSYGMHPVHFGIMMVVNLAIGFVTPPVGINLYVASSMTKLPVMTIAKKATPFMAAFIVALLFITFIPGISLLLSGV